MKMFNVIVAGGQDFNNYKLLEEKLDALLSKRTEHIVIVTTFELGVGWKASEYGANNDISVTHIPSDIQRYGDQADTMRNMHLINLADAVVCFSNDDSASINHLIAVAKLYTTPLRVFNY